jgi:hypothetical protein
MTAREREEPWAFVMKNSEKARQQKIIVVLKASVPKGEGTAKCVRVKKFSDP